MQNLRSNTKIGNQTQLTNLNIQKTCPIQRQLIVGEDQDINLDNYLYKLNENGIVLNEITQATIQQLIKISDKVAFNSWGDVNNYLIKSEQLISKMRELRRSTRYSSNRASAILNDGQALNYYTRKQHNCWTFIIKAAIGAGLLTEEDAINLSRGTQDLTEDSDDYDRRTAERNLNLLQNAKPFSCTGLENANIIKFLGTIPRGFIVSFQKESDKQSHVFLSIGNDMASEFDNEYTLEAETKMSSIWGRYNPESNQVNTIWYCPAPWNLGLTFT